MTNHDPSEVFISIKNLTKVYHSKMREVHALKGVSLDIYKGEILALLGVNGAGKTTLSSILSTLHPASSGDILFKGQSIYDDISSYRKSLGFCPQRPNLDYELTVKQNLFFAGKYFLLSNEKIHARVTQLLEEFDLVKYADFPISSLSGGYRQRVLIARAIIHEPELVIMDEPTIALDPGVRRQIWEQIQKLRAQGITVILTTHYLDEAELLSDRVCILDQGKIKLIDKAANLKQQYNKGNLEEVFLLLTQEETQ